MNNEIKWNGYTICRWVAVCYDDGRVIDEFDNMAEAKRQYKNIPVQYKYAAAEIINDDGDVNPAVYGNTLKEVTDKLKMILRR